jgi:hypothetical protein
MAKSSVVVWSEGIGVGWNLVISGGDVDGGRGGGDGGGSWVGLLSWSKNG